MTEPVTTADEAIEAAARKAWAKAMEWDRHAIGVEMRRLETEIRAIPCAKPAMTETTLLVSSAALALEIDVAIVTIMQRDTPPEYREGYFFTFKYFEQKLALDREQLRGFMRSLRNRGLTYYGTGFTEDGMLNGAGYSLTQYGHHFLNKMNAIQDKHPTPTTHRQRGNIDEVAT